MTRLFWFLITVLVLISFLSSAVDWLAHPPAAAAMAAPPTGATEEVGQPAQALSGSSPVTRVAMVLMMGLFGVLSMTPLVEEEGGG